MLTLESTQTDSKKLKMLFSEMYSVDKLVLKCLDCKVHKQSVKRKGIKKVRMSD